MGTFNTALIKSRFVGGPTSDVIEAGASGAIPSTKKEKKVRPKAVLGTEFMANGKGTHTLIFSDPNEKRSIIENSAGERYLIEDLKLQDIINTGSLAGAFQMPRQYSEQFMKEIPGGKRYDPSRGPSLAPIDLKDRDLSDNPLKSISFKKGGKAKILIPPAAIKKSTRAKLLPRAGKVTVKKVPKKGFGGCGCGIK